MAFYQPHSLQGSGLQAIQGWCLLQFGTDWCSHCRVAAAPVEQALAAHPELLRYNIEDGPGRPLGRSFKVKWWPTLVLCRDGAEVARLVRPVDTATVRHWLDTALA